jgi:hypothetical protein
MSDKLNGFGELLMKDVRDISIRTMDKIIDGRMKGEIAKKIQEELETIDEKEEILKKIVPYIVDRTLDNLLFCLEQNSEIELLYEEENIVQLSDGISGELYSDDGWIARYSKERK